MVLSCSVCGLLLRAGWLDSECCSIAAASRKVAETITSPNYKKIAFNNERSNLEISENRKQNQEANNTNKSEKAINEKYEELFDYKKTIC